MPVADELVSILGYEIKGADKLRQYQAGMDTAEKKARSSASRIAALATKYGAVLGGMFVGTAAASGVARTVKQYAGLERQMGRIGITAGASAEETRSATDQVQRLAKQYSLSTEQAVGGLDALTASGMNLQDAMAFLPSILLTAQASGAATEDIANTAIKASSALKISAGDMQSAFDIMVAGGKAGQFELKDMAAYIPELANSFATLGYSGEKGLQILIATLQTLREDTGSAGAAATQAQNIFGKMLSAETINSFQKKFGIDLPKAMKKAQKQGVDALSAFIQITEQALNGDLSKLPLLFTDQEFRLGMQSLLTSTDRLKAFFDAVNSGQVKGTAFRDAQRVMGDTQGAIDRLSTSWDTFVTKLGAAAATPAVPILDYLSGAMDRISEHDRKQQAINAGLAKEGKTGWEAAFAQLTMTNEQMERWARAGGWAPEKDLQQRVLGHPLQRPQSGAPGSLGFLRAGDDPNYNPGRGGRRRPQAVPLPPPAPPSIRQQAAGNAADYQRQLDAERAIMMGAEVHGPIEVPVVPRLQGPFEPPLQPIEVPVVPVGRDQYPVGTDDKLLPANAMPLSGASADLMAKVDRAMELAGNGAGAASVSNDMSTTNNVTNNISAPVTVNVQQPTQAPGAVGNAVANAIRSAPASAGAVPSRMQSGPAQ